jgi:hypothetical protein
MKRERRAGLFHLTVVFVAEIEIVSNCDAVARCDRKNLVLTIAIKRCPLNSSRVLAPVIYDLSAFVSNKQFPAFRLVPICSVFGYL